MPKLEDVHRRIAEKDVPDNSEICNILITGAGSGIGAAIARESARLGYNLILISRNVEKLHNVSEDCKKLGSSVVMFKSIDVCDYDSLKEYITALPGQYKPDMVIANAGVSAGFEGKCEDLRQVKNIFNTNVNGVVNTIYSCLDNMLMKKDGIIVIVSSVASFMPLSFCPSYCASKAAVRLYAESLYNNLKPHGIHVATLCPGYIETPMTANNTYPMPFLRKPDQLAVYFMKRIRNKPVRIAYPLPMYIIVVVLSFVPVTVINAVTARLNFRKPSLNGNTHDIKK